jgi:hypothetical protein
MSPHLRLWQLIAAFAAVHLVSALGSLALSYTLVMSRFDAAVFVEPSIVERVATGASEVLFEPASSILGVLGPRSHASFVQWFAVGCNSLLWGLGLALVFWRLTRRSTRTPTGGASPPPSGQATLVR